MILPFDSSEGGDYTQSACSVSDFVKHIKTAVEKSLLSSWVSGEVANFTAAASGHWYFVIRDQISQIDCVMQTRHNRGVVPPNSGDKVLLYGRPNVYAPRGRLQLVVVHVQLDGVGRLYQLFVQRKESWQARGWFSPDKKKTLPFLPSCIGIVCSSQGAALHDILRTLKLRFPVVSVIIYPAPAQGSDAADKIAAAIKIANVRFECDVLLVCRGGGGMEDLWAYNEEAVVAAIFESTLPIITGIGHEVDETLADFAADYRAATPTAAATRAVPELAQLKTQLWQYEKKIGQLLATTIDDNNQQLDWIARFLAIPDNILTEKTAQWQTIGNRLVTSMNRQLHQLSVLLIAKSGRLSLPDLDSANIRLQSLRQRLHRALLVVIASHRERVTHYRSMIVALSPKKSLARGFSIVTNYRGEVINNIDQLKLQEEVRLTFYQGRATAVIKDSSSSNKKTNSNKRQKSPSKPMSGQLL